MSGKMAASKDGNIFSAVQSMGCIYCGLCINPEPSFKVNVQGLSYSWKITFQKSLSEENASGKRR